MAHIIISLDGNIGAGKTTLLSEIRNKIKDVYVVEEPVNQWTSYKNENGKNLLEHFYEDTKRWAYTFQNCALLTRVKNIQDAINNINSITKEPQVIITERSILTDKYVFAEMLYNDGLINKIEWELYNNLFTIFENNITVNGIIYISTSSKTSGERIKIRNRLGEDKISMDYLDGLDNQHKKWINNTTIPILTLSTENDVPVDKNIDEIKKFIKNIKMSSRIYNSTSINLIN